ncbi:MAG: dethiobiotin synthase [Gammaproteobacteria bacterium]|nr:dethiobiotin synthase [Gammaproteobacteria bacterium]
MSGFFITGTDTNIGKTIVSAVITSVLNASYWKPIQSGIASDMSDQEKVAYLIDLPKDRIYPTNYLLKSCLAPDQAAALVGTRINLATLQKPITDNQLVVEGAGGVFVPLTEDTSMLDLMKQIDLPVIVVARGTLGTINHTLLTIEALLHRQLKVKGVVYSGELNHANQHTIEKWSGVKTLFHIPQFSQVTKEVVQAWIEKNKNTILEALL